MSILNEWYGEFVSQNSGQGKLNGAECSFEIGQMMNATIMLFCSVDIGSAQESEEAEIELVGIAEDGIPILAKGNVSAGGTTLSKGRLYIARGPFEVTVGDADWARTHEIRFAVTNFLFCNSVGRTGALVNNQRRLAVTLEGTDVSFEKTPQYEAVWSDVALGQSSEITCELIVKKGKQTRKEIHRLSYAICDLLTIGAGRIINWICYEARDHNGSTVYTYQQNRYTNRKAGSELVDFSNPRTVADFLEQCYPAYQQYNARHPGMLHNIGRLMMDVSSPIFKVTSSVILFSIVDALSKRDSTEDEFRMRLVNLRTMHKICLDDSEIDGIVKSRNSLVHELRFHTSNGMAEYYSNWNVLRRILLSILDYKSEYYELTQRERMLRKTTLLRCT
ncbi:MAG: hypothetical protein OXG53_13720 [Chloroflexi bacterium]|nr:hypothetical protein [Chloroflexota bacterium]